MRLNLRMLDLTGLNFQAGDLRKADFTGADLSDCDLSGARADGADLRPGAYLALTAPKAFTARRSAIAPERQALHGAPR